MIYLGNGIWSDAGFSLSHGGTWKDHKYIAIKNGRYIYPDDVKNLTKYTKRPGGKNPPGVGDKQHTVGSYSQGKTPRNNTISKTRFYAKNKKFNKAVSSQGPSAAELAQRGMMKGSSKNVGTVSKTVQYQKKLSDTNKTYQKAVSSQGPSAAELAQREKGSKKKPKSKNVNSGKPNKKKKNPFKQLAKWIKGSEGKVSVKK